MNTLDEMLLVWQKSASVMHIAHHVAAARYARYHRWFGALVAGLSALVASTIFIAALEGENKTAYLIAAMISLITAILTGINSALDLSGLANSHQIAATRFQGLRRELEEEIVRFHQSSPRESYVHIRTRWTEALEMAPPLPQDIHDRVKAKIDADYKE
jgi:hypothetical protein